MVSKRCHAFILHLFSDTRTFVASLMICDVVKDRCMLSKHVPTLPIFSVFFMLFQRASRDGKLFLRFVPVSILKNNFGGFSRSPFTSAAGRYEDRGRENCAILVRIYFQSRLRHATT